MTDKDKSFEEKVGEIIKPVKCIYKRMDCQVCSARGCGVEEAKTALLALVREEVEKCGNLNETLEDVNENWKWDDTTHNSNAVRYGINLARLEIKQSLAERINHEKTR